MTFRRQMLIIIASPFILLAGLFLLYYFAEGIITREERNHALADRLTTKILDLNFTSDRYFIYRQPAIRDLWIDNHRKVQAFLSRLRGETREETTLLRQITANGAKIGNLLVMLEEESPGPTALERERGERLMEAILLKSRMMYSDAARLSIGSAARLAETRRLIVQWTAIAAVLITGMITFGALTLTRRLVRNVSLLQEGTEKLAGGDNDVHVDVKTRDEIGQLAESFNQMSDALKKQRLYLENSKKVLEIENQLTRRAEEALRKENEVRLQAEASLQKLNEQLEERVRERTEEVKRASILLERMKEHADREAYQARTAAERHREHLRKLQRLIHDARDLFFAPTLDDVLLRITEIGREVTEARYSVIGHGFRNGHFSIIGASRRAGEQQCPPTDSFVEERGGVYRELFQRGEAIILTDAELRSHPHWWGLPEGHIPLRGLLCVPVFGVDRSVTGMIMVTDRSDGRDFTEDDAMILGQLAALTSLAIRCILERRAGEKT